MTKFYISTVMYGNDDVKLILETIDKSKIDIGVEYFAFEINDSEEQKLIKINQKFCNLASTYHSPMINAESTAEYGSIEYKNLIANWTRSLELCKKFNSKQIVFHSNNCFVTDNDRVRLQKNAMANAITLNKLCNQYNVTMLVETLALKVKGAPIFTDKEYVDFILDNNLFALVDVGHMNVNDYDYEYVLSKLNNRIRAYHIHNNNGTDDSHSTIDDGTFDYKEFCKLYKKYTPNADLVIEYIDVNGLTADKLLSDIEYLDKNTRL